MKETEKLKIQDYDKVVKWSYNLASEWVINNLVPLGVISVRKFDKYKREKKYLPKKFPRIPDEYFTRRGTWKGWRDFFGYPKQVRTYLSFDDASKVVQMKGIKNSKIFRKWKKRPLNVPSRPDLRFKEWKGWDNFFGKKRNPLSTRTYSKLNESDVRIIKHQLQIGVAGAVLAREFCVSEMQISRIKSGENWGYI